MDRFLANADREGSRLRGRFRPHGRSRPHGHSGPKEGSRPHGGSFRTVVVRVDRSILSLIRGRTDPMVTVDPMTTVAFQLPEPTTFAHTRAVTGRHGR